MDSESGKLDWPREAVLQMIEMWRNYECLYNPKNKFYHNKHARYDAFTVISEKLKVFNPTVAPTDIKNKMQYLRGQYTRELSKSKDIKSGASVDDIYVPNAYWFKELSFLQDFVKIRKGSCNLVEQNSLQSSSQDCSESPLLIESDVSPAQPSKRAKVDNATPVTSRIQEDSVTSRNQEDSVLEAAVNVLQDMCSAKKKTSGNEKDEAFSNFIRTEIIAITNANIKDELVEAITLLVLEAKRKQRLYNNSCETFTNFSCI